jgi:enoyl-CoA hydratase/carnithine racemase
MVIIGEEKFFSNGLNLEVLSKLNNDGWATFAKNMSEIHRRMLILPFPTVAAVNGHAFAGGAFIAMSCDYRIMREDRGWICISEVDAGVPVSDPMMDILRGKLPPATVRDAILTGKRYTADEAIAAGFADGKASLEDLLDRAKSLAVSLATKEPGIFANLKQTYFGVIANGLP